MQFIDTTDLPRIRPPKPQIVAVEVPPPGTYEPKVEKMLTPDPEKPVLREDDFYQKVKDNFPKLTCMNKFENPEALLIMAVAENVEESVRRELYARIKLDTETAMKEAEEYDRRYKEAGVVLEHVHKPIEEYLNIPGLSNAPDMREQLKLHKDHQRAGLSHLEGCDVCLAETQNRKSMQSNKRRMDQAAKEAKEDDEMNVVN